MNYANQIRSLAGPLLGTLTEEQSTLFTLVCTAVQEELLASLRQDADSSECSEALMLASLLLTVSTMKQLNDMDLSDFTAGTLKVSFRDDHSALAQMAYRLIAPWCADSFAFRGVGT